MTLIWNRRRPSLGERLRSSILVVVAAVGVSVGAELLRRRLQRGLVEIDRSPIRRRLRARAQVRRRVGRPRSRTLSTARI